MTDSDPSAAGPGCIREFDNTGTGLFSNVPLSTSELTAITNER